MRRFAVLLIVLLFACKEKPQPAETNTIGNATDRNPVNGTSGTGAPTPLSTESATVQTMTGAKTIQKKKKH